MLWYKIKKSNRSFFNIHNLFKDNKREIISRDEFCPSTPRWLSDWAIPSFLCDTMLYHPFRCLPIFITSVSNPLLLLLFIKKNCGDDVAISYEILSQDVIQASNCPVTVGKVFDKGKQGQAYISMHYFMPGWSSGFSSIVRPDFSSQDINLWHEGSSLGFCYYCDYLSWCDSKSPIKVAKCKITKCKHVKYKAIQYNKLKEYM